MKKTHFMRNYLLKMAESLYITEIYKLWRPNFVKLKMESRQNFLLKFLLVKQSLITISGGAMISEYLQFVQFTTVVRVFLF